MKCELWQVMKNGEPVEQFFCSSENVALQLENVRVGEVKQSIDNASYNIAEAIKKNKCECDEQ